MTWPISDARIAANAPGSTGLFHDLRDRIVYHDGLFSGIQQASNCPIVENGSFEQDSNLTTVPTGWTVSALAGGSGYVTNTDSSHGAQSFLVIHPGGLTNGGESISFSNPLPCSASQSFELCFDTYSTNANIRGQVNVLWYDKDGSQIGATQTPFDQAGSWPTSWAPMSVSLIPVMSPSRAKFFTANIVLGVVGTDPGSSTNIFIDNVALQTKRPFTRTFSYTNGSTTWTVPAGVTLVRAIVIGPGGDGTGGGYTEGYCQVTPGQVISVGAAGPGGTSFFLGLYSTGGGQSGNTNGGTGNGGLINLNGQNNLSGQTSSSSPFYRTCGMGWFGGWGSYTSSGSVKKNGAVFLFY